VAGRLSTPVPVGSILHETVQEETTRNGVLFQTAGGSQHTRVRPVVPPTGFDGFNESGRGFIKAIKTCPQHERGVTEMQKWMRTLVVGSLVAVGATACDDAGTAPNAIDDQLVIAEAALVAADGLFQDLSLAQDPGLSSIGFGGMGSGPVLVGGMGGQCQHLGGGATFQCPNLVRDGFTFTRVLTFFDGEGNEQPEGFEAGTTDQIHMVVDAEGTRERAFWTATMARSRDMWLTELLTDAHHLNGEGHSTIDRSGNPQDGGEMTFDMSVDVEWDDVVHLQPREDHPYPESGTVTRDIFVEVTRDGEVIGGRDVTTVVTFNGTQYVTMIVDGEEIEIDLAAREVKGRWGGRGNQG